MIYQWVSDLTINKTYTGMNVQYTMLSSYAKKIKGIYRPSNSAEESKGVDGYIDDTPYSVKPLTYKTMGRLPEEINIKIIYYEKIKTGIIYEI